MQKLNFKIKGIILEWLKSNDLSSCYGRQSYYQKLFKLEFYSNKTIGNNNIELDTEIFKKDYEAFDLFSTKKDWIENGFCIESNTQKSLGQDLLEKIYIQLDNEEKKLFLAITPRIVNNQTLYGWLKKDVKIFGSFLVAKPPAFIEMPTHKELFELLGIFHDFYKNKTNYDKLLYDFAVSRSKVLKRLEAQTILKEFVEKHIQNKDKFEIFYPKIDEEDYYLNDIKIVTLNISKNAFYNTMNPASNPVDKQTVSNFLIHFINYINSQEKVRMMLNKCYLLNTDSSLSYYTIVIDIKKESSIDYSELISFVLDKSKSIIGKREIKEMFKTALLNYFISIKIPLKNTQEITKINKI